MAELIVPLLCNQRTWDQICSRKMVYSWHPFLWKHKTMKHMNREGLNSTGRPEKDTVNHIHRIFVGKKRPHILLHTESESCCRWTLFAKHHLFLSGIFNPSFFGTSAGSGRWNHCRPDLQVSFCVLFWACWWWASTFPYQHSRCFDPVAYLELRQRYDSSWKTNHR